MHKGEYAHDGTSLYHEWPRPDAFCRRWSCNAFSTCFAALSRASRLVHADALEVFYKHNSFLISGDSDFCLARDSPGRLAVRSMRRLHIVFDEDAVSRRQDSSKDSACDWNRWRELIAFIARNLDLPRLRLSIDSGYYCHSSGLFDMNHWASREHFDHFARPFCELRGLKSFRVFLCFANEEKEARAEAVAMGEDYNSIAEGKPAFGERGEFLEVPDPHRELRLWL